MNNEKLFTQYLFIFRPVTVWRQGKPDISYYSTSVEALWNKFAFWYSLVVRLSLGEERRLSLL